MQDYRLEIIAAGIETGAIVLSEEAVSAASEEQAIEIATERMRAFALSVGFQLFAGDRLLRWWTKK